VKLPFGKKSDKKNDAFGRSHSAVAQPRRQGNHWANEWKHPDPDPGTPGICGYLNGVQDPEKGHHPSRFLYVRPDGQPDDDRQIDPDAPLQPSTRRVPRGFFGP